jgi:hypothetical protein
MQRNIGDSAVLMADELAGWPAVEGQIVAIHATDDGHTVYTIESGPPVDVLAQAYAEGQAAARARQPCGACPYAFVNQLWSPLLTLAEAQAYFDRDIRPRFNAWFDGWSSQLAAEGLGFNMRPKRKQQ